MSLFQGAVLGLQIGTEHLEAGNDILAISSGTLETDDMVPGISAEIPVTGIVTPGTGTGNPAVGGGSPGTSDRVLMTDVGLESGVADCSRGPIMGLLLDGPLVGHTGIGSLCGGFSS